MNTTKTAKKDLIIVISIVSVMLIGFLWLVRPFLLIEVNNQYNAAWQLAIDGDYDKAHKEFKRLHDKYYAKTILTSSILFSEDFTQVCIYYDEGDYKSAKSLLDYKIMPKLKDSSKYPNLNKKQNEFVYNMVQSVVETYSSHQAEYAEEDRLNKEQQEAERQRKAAEEAAKVYEVPYEGMSESKIDSTELGTHTKYVKNFNTECISGEIYHASMYYWYSGGNCIYSARCLQGKVSDVKDNRDLEYTNGVMDHSGSTSTNSSSSSSKKKKNQESTTEFDPDDHDIEQYYEDYKEDFEDFDDAYDDFEDNPEYWDDY